jgi:Ser/Thr protein kinase RdoA (MazF antagonist)
VIQALAEEAARHWPQVIGTPVLVMHRENSVFRVETTQGPHALRLHRPGYHAEATLRSELDWMAMLAGKGMEVPSPMPDRAGRLLVRLADGRHSSLLSWLPGAPMGETRQPLAQKGAARGDLFRALGRQMARMHDLADAWTLPPGFDRPRWDLEGLVGDQPFWGPFWTIEASAKDRALLLRTRDRCREALAGTKADFGLIHADLVRENVLVDGPTLRFIDFDDCGFGYRLFDLATTILKNQSEPDAPDLEAALLAGYQEVRCIDLTLLPVLITLRALTYLGWAQARPQDPDIETRAARFLLIAKEVIAARLGPASLSG